jgi:hypothetical protein
MSKKYPRHYLEPQVREHIAKTVAKHENAMFRELEQYYGAVHLSATDSRVYKGAIGKVFTVMFRAVAREYYDFGGRKY